MPNHEASRCEAIRITARNLFRVALGFLLLTALSGTVLRAYAFWPLPGIRYGDLIHAHSHAGFLGWVFNAFFAFALLLWVPHTRMRGFLYLFVVLQIANLGMFFSFPVQGYGAVSIFFSTLHLAGGAIFATMLWNEPAVDREVRPWLRTGLVFMLLSGLGPLGLGPLAAMDLRLHPAYNLSIYWYLHFQYNGWFIFYLIAFALGLKNRGGAAARAPHRLALPLLACGVVLTYATSALWVGPFAWIRLAAALGGGLQIIGAGLLVRGLMPSEWKQWRAGTDVPRVLVMVAASAFFLKCLLQLGAALPALTALSNHRFIVIAFLHLVFLLVVLPALIAGAWNAGWIRDDRLSRASLWILGAGILILELGLVLPVLGLSTLFSGALPEIFLGAALLKVTGIGGLCRAAKR